MSKDFKIADHIIALRDQIFSDSLLDEYTLHFVTEKEIWKHYVRELFAYYPRDLFFMKDELLQEDMHARMQILKKTIQPSFLLQDNILIKERSSGKIVGLYHGFQKEYDSYCMQVSAIHRDYRRKGIYSALLDKIILYTKNLGFNTILSFHAPCNNAVLIAKLKKDFKVTSLEISGEFGVNLWLCYFHNKELQRAYEFRCGQITFSQTMFNASQGTASELLKTLETAGRNYPKEPADI